MLLLHLFSCLAASSSLVAASREGCHLEGLEVMVEGVRAEMEAKIEALEDKFRDNLEKMEQEAAIAKSRLEAVEREAALTKARLEEELEEVRTRDASLTSQEASLTSLEASLSSLEARVTSTISRSLRDLPFVTVSAYRDQWTVPNATITYNKLLSSANNGDKPGGGDGVLDIATGVFSCLTSGHYTVTYSAYAYLESGQKTEVFILKNQENIGDEGVWYSVATGSGDTADQGSRTLVLHLEEGDSLQLEAAREEYFTGQLWRITLSITLTAWD